MKIVELITDAAQIAVVNKKRNEVRAIGVAQLVDGIHVSIAGQSQALQVGMEFSGFAIINEAGVDQANRDWNVAVPQGEIGVGDGFGDCAVDIAVGSTCLGGVND